jgi:hypothetical protein
MRLVIRLLTPLLLLFAMLIPAGGATAAPARSERTETVQFSFNMCNGGEFVVMQADIHVVSKEEPGGTTFFQFKIHGQGIGDQGNEYVFNDTFHVRQSPQNGFRVDELQRLISKGSETNQFLIAHVRDSGSSFEVDCRS